MFDLAVFKDQCPYFWLKLQTFKDTIYSVIGHRLIVDNNAVHLKFRLIFLPRLHEHFFNCLDLLNLQHFVFDNEHLVLDEVSKDWHW